MMSFPVPHTTNLSSIRAYFMTLLRVEYPLLTKRTAFEDGGDGI